MRTLTDLQRDVLREVANIGAGHAATALSTMTRSKVMISVPRIFIAPLEELIPGIVNRGQEIAVVPMTMNGGLDGHTILVFPITTAHRLAGLMLERESSSSIEDLSPLEESALSEAGNILAGTYLTALSEFMRLELLPSPPLLQIGLAEDILTNAAAGIGHEGAYVFCVETQFILDDVDSALPGYFLLLPTPESLEAMLNAVHPASC